MKTNKKKKISFNIDEDLHYEIKELSFKKRMTLTELYTKYIKEGLEREKGQKRFD